MASRKLCGMKGRCVPVNTSQMIDSPSERDNGMLSRPREESIHNLAISESFTCAMASFLKSITGEGCSMCSALVPRRDRASATGLSDPWTLRKSVVNWLMKSKWQI